MPSQNTEVGQGIRLWPKYFIVRTTGEIVPLIAVDELPPGTNLLNVPRFLDLEATAEMLNLGLQPSSSCHYTLTYCDSLAASRTTVPKSLKATHNTSNESTRSKTIVQPLPPGSTCSSDSASTPRLPTKSLTQRTIKASLNSPQDSTTLCRHWCAHGICKWGQQCRYKHIMPMTYHGLQEVGLRDWPKWYQRLNPGYFADRGSRSNHRETTRASKAKAVAAVEGIDEGRLGQGASGSKNGMREKLRVIRSDTVRSERVRTATDKLGGNEGELGDQTLKRLRAMEKERQRTVAAPAAKVMDGGSTAVERAATKDTRKWEDDEESDADEEEPKKRIVLAKEKLVDV